MMVIIAIALVAGCSALPSTPDTHNEPFERQLDNSELYKYITRLTRGHPDQSGFLALPNGIDAMAARLNLIEAAESTLDLQYYIWHDDLTGKGLYYQLIQAADRGVRVRILLDDLDTTGKDQFLTEIDAHPNIEIRLFNPFPKTII